MKKSPIIFIAMLIALAFTSCQMNTEDVKDILTATYRVNVAENTYKDNVSVDKATPKAGDTVAITITVPADFSADDLKLSVMKNNEAVTVTDVESTETNKVKKSFTMPESDVVVTVNFEKMATPTDNTGDGEEVDEPKDDNDNKETEETVDGADSEPVDETPTTEATSYKVVYNDQELKARLTLEQVNDYITQIPLVETTDYSIDKVKGVVTLTDSGYKKLNNYFATNGEPTTTEPTDTTNDGVVYAACKITLPNIDPETGEIVVTNKGKDGNSVVKKVYKEEGTGAVYLGADEGDIIEIQLYPKVINAWEHYEYFEYENELTVKDAFGQKISLTRVVKAVSYSVYTFTMPKTYVKVELPYGFEMRYSYTLDKQNNTKAEILNPGFYGGMKAPGEVVYVMVVGYEISSINGLNKNGTYKFEDITDEVLETRYVYTYEDGNKSTYVKIGTNSYFMAKGDSWDSTGVHFYSFIMPRDSITIKLTGN